MDFVRYLSVACVILAAVAGGMAAVYGAEGAKTVAIFEGKRSPPVVTSRFEDIHVQLSIYDSYTPGAAAIYNGVVSNASFVPHWQYSVGAYQYKRVDGGAPALLALLVVIALTAVRTMRNKLQKNSRELKRGVTTPADFAVKLSGLPRDLHAFSDRDVAEFCSRYGAVRFVTTAYSTGSLSTMAQEVQEMDWRIQKLEILQKRRGDKRFVASLATPDALRTPSAVIRSLSARRSKLVDRMRAIVSQDAHVHECSGTAFVTFDTPRGAHACATALNGTWRQLMSTLGCASCISVSSMFQQRHVVLARPADEPGDVYWHNLQYGWFRRFCFSLDASKMALAYTALAAGVQVGGFYARHGAGSGIGGQIVSLLIGFTVAVVQGVVLRRLEATSEAERHATRSETYASLARKQTRATIFLSGIMLVAVYFATPREWPLSTGLLGAAYSQLLSNALQDPLVSLFRNTALYYGKKWHALDKAQTQLELLRAVDPPEMAIVTTFSDASSLFCVALMFAPILPFGMILAAGGIIIRMFTIRYQLLRLCKKPPAIQGTICNAVCLAMLEGIRISTIVAMFFFVQYRGLDVTFNMASISLVVSPLPFVVSLGGFRLPIPRIFRHGPWSRKDEASESLLGHADATLNATVGEGPHYVCPPAEELLSQAERTSPNAIRIPHALMQKTGGPALSGNDDETGVDDEA